MIDINSFPHATIVRDGSRFTIVTDTNKYVTLENTETFLTDNVDFATRFDAEDLADFLHYHINDIISK